jgi:hypothetical protein
VQLMTPSIDNEIRFCLAMSATVVLMLGAAISFASAQSSVVPAEVQPSGDVGERQVSNPERTPVLDGDSSPASPSGDMRDAPWRNWPRIPGSRVPDDWSMDGAPSYGPDGRMCWPHGDHVHCR